MKKKAKNIGKLLFILSVLSLLCQPAEAYAWWVRTSHHSYRHYPGRSRDVFFLRGNSIALSLGGLKFYYAAPPVGVVVTTLPSYYQRVIINGVNYYKCDGIYYQGMHNGYMVVQPPVTDIFTVNIPTYSGGYTSVALKRYGAGFIGPQGEYYPEFPGIEQLRVVYGNR